MQVKRLMISQFDKNAFSVQVCDDPQLEMNVATADLWGYKIL
jgi:hypothetical protein